jgi:hypothetical protein
LFLSLDAVDDGHVELLGQGQGPRASGSNGNGQTPTRPSFPAAALAASSGVNTMESPNALALEEVSGW